MIEHLDPEHDLIYSEDDDINYGAGYYIENINGDVTESYSTRTEILKDFITNEIKWESENV